MSSPATLGIYGDSNTGKTLLIETVLRELIEKGHHVAVIKEAGHTETTMDVPGKDTHRYSVSGAQISILSTRKENDFIIKKMMSTKELICAIMTIQPNIDVILIEGCKSKDIPKIRIGDRALRKNTLFDYDGDIKQIIHTIEDQLCKEHGHCVTKIDVEVNGSKVNLSEFPAEIIQNVISAMLCSLHGIDTIEKASISITRE